MSNSKAPSNGRASRGPKRMSTPYAGHLSPYTLRYLARAQKAVANAEEFARSHGGTAAGWLERRTSIHELRVLVEHLARYRGIADFKSPRKRPLAEWLLANIERESSSDSAGGAQ